MSTGALNAKVHVRRRFVGSERKDAGVAVRHESTQWVQQPDLRTALIGRQHSSGNNSQKGNANLRNQSECNGAAMRSCRGQGNLSGRPEEQAPTSTPCSTGDAGRPGAPTQLVGGHRFGEPRSPVVVSGERPSRGPRVQTGLSGTWTTREGAPKSAACCTVTCAPNRAVAWLKPPHPRKTKVGESPAFVFCMKSWISQCALCLGA